MSLWRQLARGLRALTHRSTVRAELDDEVRDYFERARADHVREGLTPEEAARAARRERRDLAKAQETLRSYGWENGVDAVLRDLRQSFRRLRQSPGFAAVVMLTLALGIGVNVAIFSLTEQILLRPLPVSAPDRLINLSDPGPKLDSRLTDSGFQTSVAGGAESVFSYPMFRDLERAQESFVGIAAHRTFDASLSTGEQARRATGMFVSGSYFSVLSLRPALGRLLGPQDDRVDGQAESLVLSHAYWQSEFDGDPEVLGRRLIVNGTPLAIVGVAPSGFHGTTVGARASVFVPITLSSVDSRLAGSLPNHDNRGLHWVHLFARLEPGVSREGATVAMNMVYRAIVDEIEAPLHEQGPEALRTKSLVLEAGGRGQSSLLAPMRSRLGLLFAVSGVVLLLCCANVGGLLLVRGSTRSGEMAVRASMGATRSRLASLLLAESLILALPAAIASLPVGLLALRGLAKVPGIPAAAFDVSLSLAAALAAIGIAVVSALAFALFPVWGLVRTELGKTVQAYGARQTSGKGVTRFRTALATAQIALAMALLVMTGVFAQSLANIARIDLGLDVDSVVMLSMSPETSGYTLEASARLFDRLDEGFKAIPGVSSAASSEFALLSGESPGGYVGFSVGGVAVAESVSVYIVSPGDFFRTVGIELLAGRDFRDADVARPPDVVIVNQRFAERFGLDGDVVGQRIGFGAASLEIVGLVADAKDEGVTSEIEPQVFAPRALTGWSGSATFYVRSARPPEELMAVVRETVARIDPIVPITDLRTMRQQVRENLATEHFVAGASTAFAVLGTVLAALGLYGVLAYSVAQQSREFGLRFALGAPASRIRGMVLRQVAGMVVIGVVLGAGAAWLLGHAARGLLFGVAAGDPIVLVGAGAVVVAVTLAAAYVPARRASRVDPMTALRHE